MPPWLTQAFIRACYYYALFASGAHVLRLMLLSLPGQEPPRPTTIMLIDTCVCCKLPREQSVTSQRHYVSASSPFTALTTQPGRCYRDSPTSGSSVKSLGHITGS